MTKNKWVSTIPTVPKNKERKRCYTIWDSILGGMARAGGKVVWLTDAQLTFARIKYPRKQFEEVLERDTLEQCKKYLDATIE